jgi:ubiquinone/menaquinone biosynthesis C-methylase UbiE
MNLAEDTNLMAQQSVSHFDFDKAANNYDSWYDSARGAMYDRLEKQAIDNLLPNVTKHTRLLEVGCGTGHWSRYFSDKGFDITGIDISAEMIKIARQKQIPNSHFEITDGRNLAFKDESFDAAAAITVLEFTTEPEKIISEMVRCVKKSKGVLIIGVLNALSGYNQKRKNKLGSVYSSTHLFTPQQIRDLLSQYGIPRMQTTGFVPEKDWLLGISLLWEHLGQLFCAQRGAFIVARVDL